MELPGRFNPHEFERFSEPWQAVLEGEVTRFQNAWHQQRLAKDTNPERFEAMRLEAAEAFDHIFQMVEPYVRQVVTVATHNQIGDQVDDVVAQVFERIYKGLPGFKHQSLFTTWEMRITLNTINTYMRKWAKQATVPFEAEIHVATDGYSEFCLDAISAATDARLAAVITAMRKLSPKTRETLILFHVQGLSQDEIAEMLGIQQGTVRKRVHDGIGQVCHILGIERPTAETGRRK